MARAGPDEPLAVAAGSDETRARGHLGPRGRLELNWQEREPPGLDLPTLLTARGEVAITVGLDALETRETWSVAALRGQAHEIVLRLKADEEVVALELDRRPVPSSRRHLDQSLDDELVIPLLDPVGGGEHRHVGPRHPPAPSGGSLGRFATILLRWASDSRRSIPVGGHRRGPVAFGRDHPPWLARLFSGSTRGPTSPTPFEADRDGWLGFEFAEQPFDLGLTVAPVTPQFEVVARSTLTLAADQAEVATTISGRVWKGAVVRGRNRGARRFNIPAQRTDRGWSDDSCATSGGPGG